MGPQKNKTSRTVRFTLKIWLRWMFFGWVVGCVVIAVAAYILMNWLGKDLPDLGDLSKRRLSQVTYIYSSDDVLLGTAMSVYRKWVPLEEIPKPLQWATIVAEDKKFYSHPGIDPKSIVRALWACIKARHYVQGGSTITMQLARNLYLSPEKTVRRKLKELLLALQLERQFSKDELLELYLNTVCYGHGGYGVQAASEVYFGKDVKKIDLAQCALLASLPKRPSDLSPFINPKAAQIRRDHLLDIMVDEGYISFAEAERVKRIPVTEGLRPAPTWLNTSPKAFHFLEYSKWELARRFGQSVVDKGGLKVYTTLDFALQREVEKIAERFLKAHRFVGINQLAIVVIHIPTGHILAMYGGRPYRIDPKTGKKILDHFNRATQAFRQPGSSFKPYVYSAALEMGFKPESIFSDSAVSFPLGNGKWWSPKNYDHRYGRHMTLKTALAMSNNVIAVKLIRAVGVERTIEVAQQMGIRFAHDPSRASYALALGAVGITLLDHTSALASISINGTRVEPTAIKKVYDSKFNLLYSSKPEMRQVLSTEASQQLLEMLVAVVTSGTGRRAQINSYQVAGKTGTSEQVRDVWFVGFTPTIACGVWAGNELFKPLKSGSGGTLCAPVFREVVTATLKRHPGERTFSALKSDLNKHSFPDKTNKRDPSEKRLTICVESGDLATDYCPITYLETMPAHIAPKHRCSIHTEPSQSVLICSISGKLATPNCPQQAVISQTLYKSEIPKEACDIHIPPSPEEKISQPEEQVDEKTKEQTPQKQN